MPIDIRLFGSVMAADDLTKHIQVLSKLLGLFLHPVDLVKSNTITTIMNDDSSTFARSKFTMH